MRRYAAIRRRVLQKLDVISEESMAQQAPSDAVLESWLRQHAARYAQPALLDFEQVLFDPLRHGTRLKSDLDGAMARLRSGADPAKVGDQSLLATRATDCPADTVARDYGEQFASALLSVPIGNWQGPVSSGYGVHLVRVERRIAGHPATLSEVRTNVERDWESERRTRAKVITTASSAAATTWS